VGTPVARALDQRIACLETPSDIRGGGHVGELSSRVTEAFTQAKARANAIGRAIIIIDEADDLAPEPNAGASRKSRGRQRAHQADQPALTKQRAHCAHHDYEPGGCSRSCRDPPCRLQLKFERPNDPARLALFCRILEGTSATESQLHELVKLTANKVPYTFSDLTDRIARLALRRAWKNNQPFGFAALKAAVAEVEPSPSMDMKYFHH
jgi:hypothetical protein